MTNQNDEALTEHTSTIAAAQALLMLAQSVDPTPIAPSPLANLFAGVGPSKEFKETRLTEAAVSAEELAQIKVKLQDAIANQDMETLNKITKIGVSVLGSIKNLLLF